MVARLEVLELVNGPLCIRDKRALFKKMEILYNGYTDNKKKNNVVYSKTSDERVNNWNKAHLPTTMAMQNSDPTKFSKLKSKLQNNYLRDTD